MQLEYKPDWEETKERYRAWWAQESIGRAAIAVTAPCDDAPGDEPPQQPDPPLKRWTDLDYAAACNTYTMRRTFYGGEAFPVWSVGYPGHMSIPTFLGCPLDLDYKTGWWHPVITGDTLKTVQSAGKNLQISLSPEEVEPALKNLSARGLFISTSCKTEKEARKLLKNAEKWSKE